MSLKYAVLRAVRTFFQSAIGTFLSLATVSATGVADLAAWKVAALAAGTSGVIAVLTFIHNALEDGGYVRPVLKEPNPDVEVPIPPTFTRP